MTCSVCGGPLDHDVTHTQHKVACHAIKADGWPATARYFGPSNHAQWCRQEHDGPCLDVLLHNIFGDGCDCPEVCADCCTDPDCALREPQETTMSDHLLERIDDWSDAVDTGHELCGRDLLYETWRTVEQVRRERDAAQTAIIAARAAYFASDWDDLERSLGCQPVGADATPSQSVEVDAIRRAQATEAGHE